MLSWPRSLDRGAFLTGVDANEDVDSADGRAESSNQRSDRNWDEILQELRVTQTGTQIMSGFLLTLPFQQRFASIPGYELTIYIILVFLAATTTAFGLAPVALHRALFRRHEKSEMVHVADRLLQTVLVLVSILTAGVVLFILDFVVDLTLGLVGGIAVLVLLLVVLVVVPRVARTGQRHL
jgi:hypothetical protein